MIIKILGSAAGGGFPQWNCNCGNCAHVRRGTPGFTARTQSSLAVSGDGTDWVLLNASPDLRQQINDTPELGARFDQGMRNSPIKAAVLTNGDVDHICGLINLREMEPLAVYASHRVLSVLAQNSVFNVLNAEKVARRDLPLGVPTELAGAVEPLGLTVEAFPVPGKVALYLEDVSKGDDFGTVEGDTIGLEVHDPKAGKKFFYIPGCAEVDDALAQRIKGAELVFFDGTLFTDDEMLQAGLMPKTGKRMGHISISGPDGSIAAFEPLNVKRKIYVHINNSNPVLNENSDARKHAEAAGWDIGFDGMEIRI
jgi:pyrroloquinoline quinone biosynthesis protein B